ncbi:MAG: lantibiotic dehydratase, partial [Actinocatenispora sp.]
ASAGDAVALRDALDHLGAEFSAVTGLDPTRNAGDTYAGRALCHEETTRDLDAVVGGEVLDAIAAPLEVLLLAARWLSVALADAYGAALAELHAELGGTEVPLGELWYLAQGMLFGAGDRPVDRVAADFAQRWAGLFGLADVAPGTSSVRVSAADLRERAAQVFDATAPGWAAARIHSPDLHICAPDVDAVRRGEFTVVLGEMHTAWATFDCSILAWGHDDWPALTEAMRADMGPGRIMPLYPVGWPRYSGRLSFAFENDSDVSLAFTAASGADPARVVPVTDVTVVREGDALVARTSDGRSWPMLETFAGLLAMHAADGFKLVAASGHTPRISIDRLVVARESWRTTIGETPMPTATGLDNRFRAVRRWRREMGLPERVYVKLGTEIKPCFVDFTSPVYVAGLCNMARGAFQKSGPDVPLVISEMLPTPDQAWVPDGAGRRYFSELRLQLRDPNTGGQR